MQHKHKRSFERDIQAMKETLWKTTTLYAAFRHMVGLFRVQHISLPIKGLECNFKQHF